MLPKELEHLLNSKKGIIRIQVDATDFTTVDPIVDFSIVSILGPKVRQQWTMMIKGHKKSHLDIGNTHKSWDSDKPRLEILDLHPLLLSYNSQSGSLYFSGNKANSNQLFTDLYKTHFAFCGTDIAFTEYLKVGTNNLAILNASFGLLASGPKPLMQEYARCLEQHGLTFNILVAEQFMSTEGEKPHMQIMFLEASYFIGEQFVFVKGL